MIIDFHTHVMPPEMAAAPIWRGKCPMTIENVLEAAKEGGVDRTVISNPAHELRHMDGSQQLATVRMINQYLASLAHKHDNIYALATTVPYGGEPFLKELERVVKQDGAKGVIILSSLPGHYPDDDDALPFFQLVTDLDIPVFMHPPSIGFGEERLNVYRLASSIGRPMDGAIAISRLIVRGIFEKLPSLKLVASHLGGGICEMIGRMDYAYNLQEEAYFLGSYEPMLIKHPPSHYLKMMHFESASYTALAAAMCLQTVGADHFLFGTDAPPLIPLKRQGLEMMDQIGMTPLEREKVMGGNAARLLKLS
jgi:aminocarboxymuconate-semialdehyde decarboxylase